MKKYWIIAAALLAALTLASCATRTQEGESTAADTPAQTLVADTTRKTDSTADATETTPEEHDTTEADSDTASVPSGGKISEDEALKIAKNYLGAQDPVTGYRYSYSVQEMLTDNGKEYYKIRVSWYLEEDERYATCGYLLVSVDGSSVEKFSW